MYELGRKVLEEKKKVSREKTEDKKRKRSQSQDNKKAVKKLKMSDSPKKRKQSGDGTSPKRSTSAKKSPKKSVKQESVSVDSDLDSIEEDVPLAIFKESPAKITAQILGRLSASVSPRKRGRPTKAEAENVRAEKELLAKMKALKKKFREKEKALKSSKKSPKSSKEKKQVT